MCLKPGKRNKKEENFNFALQHFAPQTLIAKTHLQNQSAKNLCQGAPSFAKGWKFVTETAYLLNIVVLDILAEGKENQQVHPIIQSTKISNISTDSCVSSSDCSNQKVKTVCKESSLTWEKTCRTPSRKTCRGHCEDGEYCSWENVCTNGRSIKKCDGVICVSFISNLWNQFWLLHNSWQKCLQAKWEWRENLPATSKLLLWRGGDLHTTGQMSQAR